MEQLQVFFSESERADGGKTSSGKFFCRRFQPSAKLKQQQPMLEYVLWAKWNKLTIQSFLKTHWGESSYDIVIHWRIILYWRWQPAISLVRQDVLDRALSLAGKGDRLIENSHYAEDSIRPKCSELRAVSEEISSTLRSKKSVLLRAMELHHALEKVGKSDPPHLHHFQSGSKSFWLYFQYTLPGRLCIGARKEFSCWPASQWTAVSLRMELKQPCKNWRDI